MPWYAWRHDGIEGDDIVDVDGLIDAATAEFIESPPEPPPRVKPFSWLGGKGTLVRWILGFIPKGRIYVEPFAGSAAVFWHLPKPYPVEVLNDVDGRIVNFYRVLQDKEKFRQLLHRLVWTPYSRAEFVRALETLKDPTADDVTRAWAFFVAQNQGFGGMADSPGGWGRALTATNGGMVATTSRWRSRVKALLHFHQRLSAVQIDSIDGVEAIKYWDTPDTVFYVAPPYVPEARPGFKGAQYAHEMALEDHQRLVEALLQVKGVVVLSGYDHPVYRPLEEAGWEKYVRETACNAAGRIRGSSLRGEGAALVRARRVEVVWRNRAGNQARLF
jgi:DNA adenine methylase